MQYLIISPVGTSVLTNVKNPELVSIINKNSNKKNEDDIEKSELEKIKEHIYNRTQELENADFKQLCSLSAELNGIISFYGGKLTNSNDTIVLICTDTFLGKHTCEMVKSILKKYFDDLRDICIPGLQTADNIELRCALSELVNQIDILYNSKAYSQKVIFNLTGGFKAIQGFLQTLSFFYADETVYIFQTSSELMRIPKLPVKMVAEDYIKNNIHTWRRLSLGLIKTKEELEQIPDTMYFSIDDECGFTLSEYGGLIWNKIRKEIYQSRVYEPPYEKIIFSEKFINSLKGLSPDRIELINTRIDDLTAFMVSNYKKNLDRLDFKPLKGKEKLPSTHEFDAWADQNAKRIFCHFENDKLILDSLELGLH